MAKNNTLPRDKLLALAALLKEALYIESDLAGRLSQHPHHKTLLKQRQAYRQLVGELTCEFELALGSYVARIKAVRGPEAYSATRPRWGAVATCRPAGRRTPAQ